MQKALQDALKARGYSAAEAAKVVTDVGGAVREAANNSERAIKIDGLGSFRFKQRAARTTTNPQNGEKIQIAAKTVLAFKEA